MILKWLRKRGVMNLIQNSNALFYLKSFFYFYKLKIEGQPKEKQIE